MNSEHKKKLSHHADRNPRDGATGMSVSTKRHFESVKRKMKAFVDQQQQKEQGIMHLAPPPPPPVFHHPSSQQLFFDQKKAPHRTPAMAHKHLHVPTPAHKQLPHLALATPQVPRRTGKSRAINDGRLSPNVAFF